MAQRLQDRVRTEVGLSASLGVAGRRLSPPVGQLSLLPPAE